MTPTNHDSKDTKEVASPSPKIFADEKKKTDTGLSSSDSGSVSQESLVDADGYGSTNDHIFSDPAVADHWRTTYENVNYENRHRFDPSFTWSAEEERKLVNKIDRRIMLWYVPTTHSFPNGILLLMNSVYRAWIMFCGLDLHRRNINRAITDRMLEEIGMDTNDFNYGQTLFLASFLVAELPSGLISKRVGADRWIPFLICSWSIVAGSQAFLKTKAGFYVIKVLLGFLMGGFIPDIVLWLTYFFKSNELPTRLAWFWTALSTVNIVGSLLAAGILKMRGIGGWSGWQWLFLLEGIVTLLIGTFSWVLMPPGPCQTRNWFRGKDGWFSDREEFIIVNRLLRDDPSKGDMNNRQGVGLVLLWKTIKDWEMWPLYLIGLTTYIPPSPLNTYMSFILRQMGFGVFEANLMAIPAQFMFAVNLLIITWVSKRFKERSIVSSISNIWMFPFFVALVAYPNASPWARYGIMTGLLSYPYCHAILVGWNARNSNAVRTRAVSAALYNMFVQSGNILASNIYRDEDRPFYVRGNRILLGIVCYNIVQFYFVKAFYIWRNKLRDAKWNELTPEQQEDYTLNSKDEGLKRLDFRFAH